MVAATHTFDKSLMDTVVRDSVNPIDLAERSSLILGSMIHRRSPGELVNLELLDTVSMRSPMLFDKDSRGKVLKGQADVPSDSKYRAQ